MIKVTIIKIKKFRTFLGKDVWRLFLVAIALGLALFLVEFSFVFVFQGFLQAIGLIDASKLTVASWYPRSLAASLVNLLLFGIVRAIVHVAKYYVNSASAQAFLRLQRSRILEYGLNHVDSVSSHALVTAFSERVGHASVVLQSISQIVLMGTCCTLFLFMGLRIAPLEMVVGIFLLGLLLFPLRKFNHQMSAAGKAIHEHNVKISRTLLQGLKHNFFLNIYGMIKEEVSKGRVLLSLVEQSYRKYYWIVAVKSSFPNLIGIFVICCISFVSIRYLHTPGMVLVSFLYLFIRLAQGLSEVSIAFSDFTLNLGAFKDIYRFHENLTIDQQRILKDDHYTESLPADFFSGGIQLNFENVSFAYLTNQPVLKGVYLNVSKGQVLLIKGPSGVGKSTLLSLALGIKTPQSGKISINGRPVLSVRNFLFEKIGYVGPEPYMIEGTIRDNLLFGHFNPSGVSDELMLEALNKAQIKEEGQFNLDYFVNEQTPLSTGQKQRLSIARAILRRPQLLVLDEATANLDGVTESNFIRSVSELLKGTTTIVISHKNSFDEIATYTHHLKKV